ncbi:hypothetical protein ACFOMD_01015 [Sphingoaurantiacus capsulatus]|uniref:TraB/GumN family protein n=1 Tax=Sphingoaurantiacus capsulatus TaxID=1771310 RepID=A0ABV7X4P9_9SPHN
MLRRLIVALAFIATPAAAAPDSVTVIGALHGLHAKEPAFDYGALKAAILAFKPDLLVLEVRPDELAGRTATPGRPEYPAVIWPLLAETKVAAVAMEPGGETFKEMTGAAGLAFDAFGARDPEGVKALSAADDAIEAALLAHWRSPAQTQNEATAAVTSGFQQLQFALVGGGLDKVQARWDGFMAARVVEAVRAYSGKRVLVLGSYRNRAVLEAAVRQVAPGRVVSPAPWLEAAK